MTPVVTEVGINWTTIILALIAGIPASIASVIALLQAMKVHGLINGRMSELLEITKSGVAAQATLDEIKAEHDRKGVAARAIVGVTSQASDAATAAAVSAAAAEHVLETARMQAIERSKEKASAAADILLTASMASATKAVVDRDAITRHIRQEDMKTRSTDEVQMSKQIPKEVADATEAAAKAAAAATVATVAATAAAVIKSDEEKKK